MRVRWSRSERDARVANRFEKPRTTLAEGMTVQISSPGPGGAFTWAHLQEAYELGRRRIR